MAECKDPALTATRKSQDPRRILHNHVSVYFAEDRKRQAPAAFRRSEVRCVLAAKLISGCSSNLLQQSYDMASRRYSIGDCCHTAAGTGRTAPLRPLPELPPAGRHCRQALILIPSTASNVCRQIPASKSDGAQQNSTPTSAMASICRKAAPAALKLLATVYAAARSRCW